MTTLKTLRAYSTWQDAGETGGDPSLTDDTVVHVRPDGSVGTEGGGVLVEAGDVDANWMTWLRRMGLVR